MAKNTRPGEGLSHNPANGGNHPSKVTLFPRSSTAGRRGPFRPSGYVRQSEDRLCESVRRAYPRVCGDT